jgi:hypothetical protein
MMRKLLDPAGKVTAVEYTIEEVSQLLGVDPDQLREWSASIIPSSKDEEGKPLYRVASASQLKLWQKRAVILATGMSEQSLAQVEESGRLDSYAALAEDAPDGISAHIWRSYALVVLMQAKYSLKLTAEDLAKRAGLVDTNETGKTVLGVETAKKHLRFLQALGYLQSVEIGDVIRVSGRNEKATYAHWIHKGLPKAWQGQE